MGIWGSLTGSDAAKASNAAAQDTYRKQQDAISRLLGYSDTLPGQYNDIAKGYDPYRSAGTDALGMLRAGLGLGGDQQAFVNAYRGLPGYQSALDAGSKAVAGQANAGNMLQSGRALKALQSFGQDYEDRRSGDYLSRLMGLSGQGMQATGAATGLQAQGLGQQAGLRQSAFGGQMNAAGTVGQGMVAGAQAQQQGLQNLLGTGAYLVGSYLGGPMGGSAAKGLFGGMGSGAPTAPYGQGQWWQMAGRGLGPWAAS